MVEVHSRFFALMLAALLFGPGTVEAVSYKNHRLFSVEYATQEQHKALEDFSFSNPGIVILDEPFVQNVSVVVDPEQEDVFRLRFGDKGLGLNFKLVSQNVQSLIDTEKEHASRKRETESTFESSSAIDHEKYHTYSEIVDLLNDFSQRNPDVMEVFNLTHSTYENRQTIVAKVHGSRESREDRPAIVLEAGAHAREWISPAVNLWVIEHLVESYRSGDENVKKMLDTFDWYIIPVANPDGYAYSHETDRFWRKNRRQVRDDCWGVDINRNFDVDYDRERYTKSCQSSSYHGEQPFSETEAVNIKELVESLADRLLAYVSIHSYAQAIIMPWAYTVFHKPDNFNEIKDTATSMRDGFRRLYATEFSLSGAKAAIAYTASGTSFDWALKSVPGIFSIAIELRAGENSSGFIVNPAKIVPFAKEYFESLIAMGQKLKAKNI